MAEYRATFSDLVAAIELLGLNEDLGAEGALRESIHAVEDIVKEVGLQAATVEMLTARRREKDYFLRGKSKYIPMVRDAADRVKSIVRNSNLPPATKERVYELSDDYWSKFYRATELSAQRDKLVAKLDTVSARINDGINEVVADRDRQSVAFQGASGTVVGVALLAGFVLAIYLSRDLTRPIRRLHRMADEIKAGNYGAVAEVETRDEIGALARAFNEMASRVNEGKAAILAEKASVERKVELAVASSEAQNRQLGESVEAIVREMERFAEGDLSVRLDPRDDGHVGKLYEGFNRSVGNMRRLISGLHEAATEAATASEHISSSSEELAAGALEQKEQIERVAESVDAMTRNVVETSDHATRAAEEANRSGELATKGGEIVRDAVEGMNRVADVVGKAAETVEGLGASSAKIGSIIEVIDGIADQTNLLALNAAIEAARAGEQGRGFAVVADEVRKLAERTVGATKEITLMIRTLQSEARDAVETISGGKDEVFRGRALAEKAGASLEEIIEASKRVADTISRVSEASAEQADEAESVSQRVAQINSVVAGSADAVRQVARSAEDLNQLTEALRQQARRFRRDRENQYEELRQYA
jgi:methyl-accepting chemotaxis protein